MKILSRITLSFCMFLLILLAAIFIGCTRNQADPGPTSSQNAVAVIPSQTQGAQIIPSVSPSSPPPVPSPTRSQGLTGLKPKPTRTHHVTGLKPVSPAKKPSPHPSRAAQVTRPKPQKPVPRPTYVTYVPRPKPGPTDFRSAITITVQEQAGGACAKNVDLVLCIDVSGSMQPLIDMAKQKLWDIARDIRSFKEKPSLRIALISFGSQTADPDSGWVRVETDFTENLNLVYGKLANLKAGGEQEYVGKAILVAVNDLSWSRDAGTLRTVFVAGNESIHQDPRNAIPEVCKLAKEKDIIVNSIFCKILFETHDQEWAELARLGNGRYSAIEFTEKMYSSKSPTAFSTRMAREKPGFESFQGQLVGIIGDNDLLIKDSSLNGGTKTFKVDGKTRYVPPKWRPSPGGCVILYYDPAHPSKICEIEDAR